MRGKRGALIAVAVACTLAAAACTGSANGTGSASGNVSPVKGLAAVTPAGTRPVSSVVSPVFSWRSSGPKVTVCAPRRRAPLVNAVRVLVEVRRK